MKIGGTTRPIDVLFRQGGILIDLVPVTTIRFRYKVGNVLTERSMVKSSELGRAYYVFTNADFVILNAAGDYECDFKLTYPSGDEYSPTVGVDVLSVQVPLS